MVSFALLTDALIEPSNDKHKHEIIKYWLFSLLDDKSRFSIEKHSEILIHVSRSHRHKLQGHIYLRDVEHDGRTFIELIDLDRSSKSHLFGARTSSVHHVQDFAAGSRVSHSCSCAFQGVLTAFMYSSMSTRSICSLTTLY